MLFNCFTDTQSLRNQDDSGTGVVSNVFAEVIGHAGDIVGYKYSSVFGGDSQDDMIGESLKRNVGGLPLRRLHRLDLRPPTNAESSMLSKQTLPRLFKLVL